MHWLHALADPSLRHEFSVTQDKLSDVAARSLAQARALADALDTILRLRTEIERLRGENPSNVDELGPPPEPFSHGARPYKPWPMP